MNETASSFIAKSTIKAADIEHRRKINFNIGKYNAVVPVGKQQFADVSTARERAKNAKWRAIENLDTYLEEFENKITARGAKVIWAETTEEALAEIENICKEKNCKTLVKSKSMVTEEIHLNHYLEKIGIESVETEVVEAVWTGLRYGAGAAGMSGRGGAAASAAAVPGPGEKLTVSR